MRRKCSKQPKSLSSRGARGCRLQCARRLNTAGTCLFEVSGYHVQGMGFSDVLEIYASVPSRGEGAAVCTIWCRCAPIHQSGTQNPFRPNRIHPTARNNKRTLTLVEGK